jgi:hypothetical protein
MEKKSRFVNARFVSPKFRALQDAFNEAKTPQEKVEVVL